MMRIPNVKSAVGLRDIGSGLLHYRNATWAGTVHSICVRGRCSSAVVDFILSLNLCDAWYQRGEALNWLLLTSSCAKEQVQEVYHWNDW